MILLNNSIPLRESSTIIQTERERIKEAEGFSISSEITYKNKENGCGHACSSCCYYTSPEMATAGVYTTAIGIETRSEASLKLPQQPNNPVYFSPTLQRFQIPEISQQKISRNSTNKTT